MTEPFPLFEDDRGRLLPVELDDVDFHVRRVFVVHGAAGGPPRGDHAVPCEELVVLLSGSARFRVASASGERTAHLGRAGETVRLEPGDHVIYDLDGPTTAILVLASEPYGAGQAR